MNKIIWSIFQRGGKVKTAMKNKTISERVRVLMEGISTGITEDDSAGEIYYTHHDIGTMEEMESLFKSLDACK